MIVFKAVFVVSFLLWAPGTWAALSDKRLCANEDCSEPISQAITLIAYAASEDGMLSFPAQQKILIYSKSAGTQPKLWGAEYKGRRGYVPTTHIRETKVLFSKPQFVVDTERPNDQNKVPSIEPSRTQQVVDGTTIYPDDLAPTTAVPPKQDIPAEPSKTIFETFASSISHFIDTAENLEQRLNETAEEEEDDYVEDEEDDQDEEEDEQDEQVENLAAQISEVNVTSAENVEATSEQAESGGFWNNWGGNTEGVEKPADEPVESLLQAKSETVNDPETVASVSSNSEVLQDSKVEPVEILSQAELVNTLEETAPNTVLEDLKVVELNSSTVEPGTVPENTRVDDSTFFGDNKIDEPAQENAKVEEPILNKAPEEHGLNRGEEPTSGTVYGDNRVEESTVLKLEELSKEEPSIVVHENNVDPVEEKISETTFGKDKPAYKDKEVATKPWFHSTLNDEGPKDEAMPEPRSETAIPPLPHSANSNNFVTETPTKEPLDFRSEALVSEPVRNAEIETKTLSPEEITPEPLDFRSELLVSDHVATVETETLSPEVATPEPLDFRSEQLVSDPAMDAAVEIVTEPAIVESLQTGGETDAPLDYQSEALISDPVTEAMVETVTESLAKEDDFRSEALASDHVKDAAMETVTEPSAESVGESGAEETGGGFDFSGWFGSFFSPGEAPSVQEEFDERGDDVLVSKQRSDHVCDSDESQSSCGRDEKKLPDESPSFFDVGVNELLVFLGISGATVVVFLWGYMLIDKTRREAPLIAKINHLEKALLVSTKENQILTDKLNESRTIVVDQVDHSGVVLQLRSELEDAAQARGALEEQVQVLEKELENSTEVGLELNRMLSEVLSSQNCSDTLMSNIEQLQRQLVEQQSTINTINARLGERDTENHELRLELEIDGKKVLDLQAELDKMVANLLRLEEEKEQSQARYETRISELEQSARSASSKLVECERRLDETRRALELKTNEYDLLKDEVKGSKGDVARLLDANALKAEVRQLQSDNVALSEHVQQNRRAVAELEKDLAAATQDAGTYKKRYEEADREKLEAHTRLEVLNAYFKEREAELQKELSKHESKWLEKEGEATSTVERLRFMQEEIQNFKAQNASLKQEIVSQEVELKSQISVLEKKAHENWVSARQAERKLEDARNEAAQLRNRLTLRERGNEDKNQNRLQSPLESNGDHAVSPLLMNVESPASPPLIYGARDRLTTTSPPLPPPGMHGFLPPPPFMPPPPLPGMPPFMPPPPPSLYPGDRRPPPLGRMSSPPVDSRYSPDSRAYSPYDRNTPSPTDDEYYGPPPHRGYSPYNGRDRREYGRPPPARNLVRNNKGAASSGSANSNESLEKINRHHSKV